GNLAALSAALGASGNVGRLARVDGGNGIDSLVLAGASLSLDLTGIAFQGNGNPGSASRLESIERIDATGSGNNAVALTLADVLALSGNSNTVLVDGNAGDTLTL